ncbi:hypothetical protein EDC18_106189 [Natranaerovirga pectinivora]|uniref:DUF1573 domain-containing protein n=1 Tax=Natranaerovirga pectinivora TaxID=682400 RepID=A0A4R3MQ34_9FIRM|nr:DUF1573 domain-containing protein [Natranaerovirga pectinivora]TCT14385.1 hypothetical protein EDC18_106189 [Natranaerovirga pectinivora]
MSAIHDLITEELQFLVEEYECINKSILDQITKLSEYSNKINRSIIKACTQCGCLKIEGKKLDFETAHDELDTQCYGNICPDCKEFVEKNMGSCLYYLAALCNTLDLNLYDILLKEVKKVDLLRKYNIE